MADTEDEILNRIPDLDGPGDDTDTNTDTTQPQAGGESDELNLTPSDDQQANTQTDQQQTPTNQQPTPQATGDVGANYALTELSGAISRRDGLVEMPNRANPRLRDIVDPKTGAIIALGGRERTYFERAQQAFHQAGVLNRKLQEAVAANTGNNAIVQRMTSHNLSAQDGVVAIDIMARFLKEPVKVLEEMVAEVKAKGYPIPFLEQGISPGIDTAAIGRMIDTRMAPLTAQTTNAQQTEQIQQEARVHLESFLDDFPDAQHNLGALAQMMDTSRAEGKDLSIQNAYVMFTQWAYKNGIDPTIPVGPQIEAKRNQHNGTPNNSGNQQQPQPQALVAPLPNGRNAVNGREQPVDSQVVFKEDARWDDIVRHAMRSSGYQLN